MSLPRGFRSGIRGCDDHPDLFDAVLAVPVSTTHTLVGAVVGVGLAGGAKAVDFQGIWEDLRLMGGEHPGGFGSVVIFVAVASISAPHSRVAIAFASVVYVMWATREGDLRRRCPCLMLGDREERPRHILSSFTVMPSQLRRQLVTCLKQ